MAAKKIVVAGHVCLDIIPQFLRAAPGLDEIIEPGKLVDIGPAVVSTGGAVANTGLALHRLGLPVALMGKVGNDPFGRAILDVFNNHDPALTETMIIDPDVASSYSVVINPPDIDRCFLHCPGANDTFSAADIRPDSLAGAAIFHFGYPPLMRQMYARPGELAQMLTTVRRAGLTTSLDMALPDPASPAGRVDWAKLLAEALPCVDLFVPSFEEIIYMLNPQRGLAVREAAAAGVPLGGLTSSDISALAGELLAMGAAAVMIKLSKQGAVLHVTDNRERLQACGAAASALTTWRGAAIHAPCYEAQVAGTTGAGDCEVAGLLAALAKGCCAATALRMAMAAGSASVERPDATSGVPSWQALEQRLAAGWGTETVSTAGGWWQS
jgi:sugar/nucleoside kinase (ribokinase family)